MVWRHGPGHHLRALRTDGGPSGGPPRGLPPPVQGGRARPRLRGLLEGMGRDGGEGDQRVSPELPGPPAPRDAPESLRRVFRCYGGVMVRMHPPAPFGLPPMTLAAGANPAARCSWHGARARRHVIAGRV